MGRLGAIRPAAAKALAASALTFAIGSGFARAGERPGANPIAETFPLVFDSERIRLEIIDDSLEVRGTYVLLCRAPVMQPIPLFYPFPHDSLMGGARLISLFVRVGEGAPQPGHWEDLAEASGVRCWIPPCSADTVVAEAVYRQKIQTGYARYILTSTRIWGRPLRRASFEIWLPPGAIPIDFSFPFERRDAGGEISYVYEAQDFLPDHDIIVRWRR